ncbi:MAG: DUF3179 domain-containing protein [Candidatus Brocadiaceae bacterium]|nr:DUF3179 domain-containing protein [Candidatus Brocadiaceae bacterium]
MAESLPPVDPIEPPCESPEEPAPTDFRRNIWLLFIILAVIGIAWLVAVTWERLDPSLLPPQAAPAPSPQKTPENRQPRRAEPVEVSRVIGSERESILAAPAVLLRPSRVPYRLQRLFDVTDKAGGFSIGELFRIPDAWLDHHPSLVLADGAPPGYVPLAGLSAPGPEDRLIVLQTPEATRAYPVALVSDFLVRDSVDGRSCTISWSVLSQTASCLVADGDCAGVQWGDTGLIYRGDVVLYDRQTGSLWDSFSGRALTGPHAGASAPRHTVSVWPWEAGKAAFPDARVPDLEPGQDVPDEQKAKVHAIMRDYLASDVPPIELRHFRASETPLPPKAFVLGIAVGDEARAYPLAALAAAGSEVLTDSIAGHEFRIHVTSPQTAHVAPEVPGVIPTVRLWYAWKEACPHTSLYELPSAPELPS